MNWRNYLLLYKYRKEILILSLLGLISSAFSLIAPYFSRLFIDKAFINKDISKFLNLSILGAALFVFSVSVRLVNDIIKNKSGIKLRFNLTNRFVKKIYSLDLSFFQSRSTGENIYRLGDVESVANFILEQCPNILVDIVRLLIILCISLYINVRMTIFLVLLSPLFLLHSVYLQRKLRPIYEEIWKHSAKLSRQVYEAFSKILIIKAFGLESHERRSYLKALIKNTRWRIRSFRWITIRSISSSFLSKAVYGSVSIYGGWLVIKGGLTIGSYTAVMLYIAQLGGLLESLANRFGCLAQETVSLNRFFEIMDIQPQIKDMPGAIDMASIKGEIRFNNAYFGYQRARPIFKGLSLAIPPFSWVGIAGPSGCGKTTLVNLILRLYEPWDGQILIDGLDLKRIGLKSLREKVAIATQQPLLFDISIKENIAYGLKDINQDRVEEAADIARVHDFISQLPNGYDTFIGEDACRLSQGLKQRIAIARAILRNPDLLILDEATSSVDLFTEEKIFQALREKRQGLSTIVISHRLSSIKESDRIYFLREDGRLEEGSHNQLLSESPAYREFFHNQMEEVAISS